MYCVYTVHAYYICYSYYSNSNYCYLLLGKTIAGTTDSPTEVTHNPQPTEEDIRFILKEIKDYLSPDLSGQYGKMY